MEIFSPAELRERLDRGETFQLLDVREREELAICQLDGVVHIPLGELVARSDELDKSRPTVCICHHGIRSARAAGYLMSEGFDAVYNLAGGVDRWSLDVDPGMPRY